MAGVQDEWVQVVRGAWIVSNLGRFNSAVCWLINPKSERERESPEGQHVAQWRLQQFEAVSASSSKITAIVLTHGALPAALSRHCLENRVIVETWWTVFVYARFLPHLFSLSDYGEDYIQEDSARQVASPREDLSVRVENEFHSL